MDEYSIHLLILSAIILFFLVFALVGSLWLYNRERKKSIELGLEDDSIFEKLHKELEEKRKKHPNLSLKSHLCNKRKNKLANSITFNIVIGILVLGFIGVFTYVSVAGKDGLIFIGNSSTLVVASGSMSKANANNEYLKDESLNKTMGVRIAKNSLVGFTKVESEDDVSLYDIVAFKTDDTIMVHRLISIQTHEGKKLYTFRGDANGASFSDESNLSFDSILGVYNGLNNVALGYVTSFFQSGTGLITVLMLGVYLSAVDWMNGREEKLCDNRVTYLLENEGEEE